MFQDSVLYMKYATEEDPSALISGIFRRDSVMSWRPTTGPIILSRPDQNQRGHSLIFNHEEIAPGRRRYLPQSPIGRDCSVQIAIMGNLCLQWGGRLLGHK